MLGETPPDPRSRAMSSPGIAKGAPSFTIQSAVQTASNAQENYTSETINWFYKTIFASKKYSSRQLEPSGKACPAKERQWRNPREMANSRGLALDLLQ